MLAVLSVDAAVFPPSVFHPCPTVAKNQIIRAGKIRTLAEEPKSGYFGELFSHEIPAFSDRLAVCPSRIERVGGTSGDSGSESGGDVQWQDQALPGDPLPR